MKTKSINLFIFTSLLIVFACERDWNNPWDEFNNLSPDEWAPQNLQIMDVSITEKKLTWTYDGDSRIEGFKLDRKKGDEPWQVAYQTFPKETREWNDTEITPDPSLTYQYRLYAFAGKNCSGQITKSVNAQISAPSNLQITPNSITSVTLSWQDNSNGEDGFKIDRKINSGAWELIFASVGSNLTSFTDININWQTNDYTYRVYSFYDSYNSSTIESAISWPEVNTTSASNVTYNSATSGGSVTIQGNYSISARGICYGTAANPDISGAHTTDGSGVGAFSSNLTGLIQVTSYNMRAYATTSFGTSYGPQINFTTLPWQCGTTFTDSRDNNDYLTVQIGNQCWMRENLAYLPSVSPSSNGSLSLSYYYVYGYEGTSVTEAIATSNYQTYGVLYNWPASSTACPEGWHLPSDAEWTVLTDYVSSQPEYLCNSNTDFIAKAFAANAFWNSSANVCAVGNDQNTNNATNFAVLPGGYRNYNGNFYDIGHYGTFWGSTQNSSGADWYRYLSSGNAVVSRIYDGKDYGFSMRCLRD